MDAFNRTEAVFIVSFIVRVNSLSLFNRERSLRLLDDLLTTVKHFMVNLHSECSTLSVELTWSSFLHYLIVLTKRNTWRDSYTD